MSFIIQNRESQFFVNIVGCHDQKARLPNRGKTETPCMICRPLCLSSLLTWAPVEKETGDLDFVGPLPNRDLWCTLSFFDDECIILKIRAPTGDRAGVFAVNVQRACP